MMLLTVLLIMLYLVPLLLSVCFVVVGVGVVIGDGVCVGVAVVGVVHANMRCVRGVDAAEVVVCTVEYDVCVAAVVAVAVVIDDVRVCVMVVIADVGVRVAAGVVGSSDISVVVSYYSWIAVVVTVVVIRRGVVDIGGVVDVVADGDVVHYSRVAVIVDGVGVVAVMCAFIHYDVGSEVAVVVRRVVVVADVGGGVLTYVVFALLVLLMLSLL